MPKSKMPFRSRPVPAAVEPCPAISLRRSWHAAPVMCRKKGHIRLRSQLGVQAGRGSRPGEACMNRGWDDGRVHATPHAMNCHGW